MPRYDMVCKNSSCVEFEEPKEVVKRMSEDNPNCEVCDSTLTIVHLVSGFKPIFNGSGWCGQRK
jgi:predicted nucleic acid-binding Zn ribbon protein